MAISIKQGYYFTYLFFILGLILSQLLVLCLEGCFADTALLYECTDTNLMGIWCWP